MFLPQFPPERLRGIARTADEAGLDELWLWEDCFWESGIAAAWTSSTDTGRFARSRARSVTYSAAAPSR